MTRAISLLLPPLVAAHFVGGDVTAQTVLQSWFQSGLRSPIECGDVDNDGVNDVAFATDTLYIYSGATGAPLHQLFQGTNGWPFSIWKLGDVDGDAHADVMFSAYNGVFLDIRVISGATGSVLYSYPGPFSYSDWAAAGLGDLNGDGRGEFAIGYPNATVNGLPFAGRIDILDGATGTVWRSHVGTAADQRLSAIRRLGDYDGDGFADFFALDATTIRLISGLTGNQLPFNPFPSYWNSYRGVGDVNGDGFDDFASDNYTPNIGFTNIWIYAGPTGALLWHHYHSWNFPGPIAFASAIGSAGDIDGDGFGDVLMGGGAVSAGPGWSIMSGRDHSVLFQTTTAFGSPFESMGDVNDDEVADVLTWLITSTGPVRILSGIAPGVVPIGDGCTDGTNLEPTIGIGRGARLGQTMTVNLSNANPGLFTALLGLGISTAQWNGTPLPMSLGGFGMPHCTLYIDPLVSLLIPTAGQNGGRHNAQHGIPVPPNNQLLGLDVFAQWVVLEQTPGGALGGAATRAMRMRVVP